MVKHKNYHTWSPYLLTFVSFITIILFGSFLLALPISQTSGEWGNYMDTFFIATSATCVTGLSTYGQGIGNALTFFGQLVVLAMIQIGGLGFITILMFFITLFKKRMQMKSRYLIHLAVGSDSIGDTVKFIRKIILISFSFEAVGTLLLLPAFLSVPDTQFHNALWNSIFTSVSAFNNAGFDIFGATSLVRNGNVLLSNMPDASYVYMCVILMLLIVFGGLSFLVIVDIFDFKKRIRQWKLFTKIVLTTTGILLASGFLIFFLTEGLKGENAMDTLSIFFQSVTCRTAGFATYDQANLSSFGKIMSCVLMYFGGSPLSTAGGIKTTTVFLVILAIVRYLSGKKVTAFYRKFSEDSIIKAMAVVFISLFSVVISIGLITIFEKGNTSPYCTVENITFETFSAFGTVGLSASLTPTLSIGSKIILCVLMLLGRLGPMTVLQIVQNTMDEKVDSHFDYVEENILIG